MTIFTTVNTNYSIGKKSFFADQQLIAGKLEYFSGISYFDDILSGKKLKDIHAVIHLEKFPNGIVFKIAKLFKTYNFPVSNDEIEKIILSEIPINKQLIVETKDKNKITFGINDTNLLEVKDFLNDVNIMYESDKIKNMKSFKSKQDLKNIEITISQKEVIYLITGAVSFISFFLPWFNIGNKGSLSGYDLFSLGNKFGFDNSWVFIIFPFCFLVTTFIKTNFIPLLQGIFLRIIEMIPSILIIWYILKIIDFVGTENLSKVPSDIFQFFGIGFYLTLLGSIILLMDGILYFTNTMPKNTNM